MKGESDWKREAKMSKVLRKVQVFMYPFRCPMLHNNLLLCFAVDFGIRSGGVGKSNHQETQTGSFQGEL